jgi:hypothetical protein
VLVEMNPPREGVPAARPPRSISVLGVRLLLGLGGVLLLYGSVLAGAISQLADGACGTCTAGPHCTPATVACAASYWDLLAVSVLVAGGAAMIAASLSAPVVHRITRTAPERPRDAPTRGRATFDFVAPLVMFFGWGWLALGLMLPLDLFASCHPGCSYGYDLAGVPYALVVAGISVLIVGNVLVGLSTWTRRPRDGGPTTLEGNGEGPARSP